jgi:hypothetical protein
MNAELQGAIEKFQDIQRECSRYGATDTEPRAAFERLMINAVLADGDDTIEIPSGPGYPGWELFTDMPGSISAAKALTRQATIVVDLIQNATKAANEAHRTVEHFVGIF